MFFGIYVLFGFQRHETEKYMPKLWRAVSTEIRPQKIGFCKKFRLLEISP